MAESIALVFSSGAGKQVRKGPFRQVRFEGEVIRSEVGGPVLAKHEDHHWQVDGAPYLRLEMEHAQIHFERVDGSRSKVYGPYEMVSFVDGVAYADRSIFAFADRSMVDWYCHEDNLHWPLMVVAPA